uniref:Uncharacterized protein n=1 Tax=Siphoviridae sp. ctE6L85 TaxID=2826202 RepID=A0A8S5QQS8_9CAUD|nr:MAG TPA: hypothetical protein [Siphoviridae sp. ctE6L85]
MMSGVVMTTACKSMGCSHTVFLSLCSSAVCNTG